MAITRGRVETFHDDQVIVALPHLNIVTRALTYFGVRYANVEPHEALGLAKVSGLANLGRAVNQLRQQDGIGADLAAYETARGAEVGGTAPLLDVLSKGLRLHFTQVYAGWAPEFGKNRGVAQVLGFPHVGGPPPSDPIVPAGSAVGDPRPTTAAVTFAAPDRGRGVRVGLLDTRIYPAGSLAGRYLARPYSLIDPRDDALEAAAGHGTFVASCILQQAPAAELHVHRVLDDTASGDTWTAATSMVEMAETGVDIMNLSFGQFSTDDNQPPLVLETAVNLISRRTVIVAAAGNHGGLQPSADRPRDVQPNTPVWPAACLGVIAVGALDQAGKLASFTPDVPWTSLLATGVNVTGDYLRGDVLIEHRDADGGLVDRAKIEQFDGTAEWAGSSFAAAFVSGKLAAQTRPGAHSAHQARSELLQPGATVEDNGVLFCVPER